MWKYYFWQSTACYTAYHADLRNSGDPEGQVRVLVLVPLYVEGVHFSIQWSVALTCQDLYILLL